MGAVITGGQSGNETKNYELLEGGVYPGRGLMTIDLGTHDNTHDDAPKGAVKQECMIIWEVSGEPMADGRPFTVNKRFTMSLNEKSNLRKLLASWRGRDFTAEELKSFELGKVLDAPCMLNIVQSKPNRNGKVYNNVMSVMPMPKGMTLEPRVNELVDFGIDDRHNEELLAKLWPWVRSIVMESYEATGRPLPGQEPKGKPAQQEAGYSDIIPF